ncbi:sporulation integral membrane protein YtvI [Gracilibacillus marinus]|jgi:sporulation integral membrane protein YtvI|uniref:Sporulation integral membrane protein YtvI n=1 Tax=Gracilibacillus marinus TaxID=630535 RepID=A0ABV8VUC6_9BACI
MKNFTKQYWKLIITLLVLVVLGYFILPVSIPLILAFFTALILIPLVRIFIEKLKLSRKMAVTIVFLLFILIISTIGTYAIAKTVSQVVNFTQNLPDYVIQINKQILEWESDLDHFAAEIPDELVNQVKDEIEDTLVSASNDLREIVKFERVAKAVSAVPELIVSLLVYLIALFLFLLEIPKLKAIVYNHFTVKTAEKVKFMNARLSYVILGFFKAQFLVSIIIFVVSLIGLFIIVPEYALIMSLIIWAIDFVPIIGSIVILGPWALYMFITGDTVTGIQLSVLAIILLAIRRTVEPKVMGKHIGLSPLATLIAMYVGLKLLGILGFIVGPLLVIAFNSAKEAGIIKLDFKI